MRVFLVVTINYVYLTLIKGGRPVNKSRFPFRVKSLICEPDTSTYVRSYYSPMTLSRKTYMNG